VALTYIVDSSALVKRYVQEVGTAWVRGIPRRSASTVIYIAHITAVEVTCAVARRREGKTLMPARASSILPKREISTFRRFSLTRILQTRILVAPEDLRALR
jgi:predicted nucleic acid-binding protein